MDIHSNSIGQRVSEVLSQLKRLKKISGDKEIANLAGYKSASSITEVKQDRAEPSQRLLDVLNEKYNVSTKYILEGAGTPFDSQNNVIIQDYERRTIAMIVGIDAKCDVVLSALSEVLAKQKGQLASVVLDHLTKKVNSLIQNKIEEL